MIRINAIPNSSAAKSYYEQSDYYLEGQEEPAHWHGKGAEMLGLSGPVTQEAFERLCENQHPQSGRQLTVKHLQNRRVGYDFTFSVPKSVSLAYALGGDVRIPDAFREAVAETMAEMEREMAVRVRKGGADHDEPSRNMIWADFLHKTTRPIGGQPDPQLHVHAVVFNATLADDGQWKAGQFGGLKADAPYFQAAFRTKLVTKLQGLGYAVRRTKDDFELLVPERTLKEFSRRTRQIDQLADELGVTRPETKAKLGATSREKKTTGLTWGDLLGLWGERLRPGEAGAIHAVVARADRSRMPELTNREALDWAIAHEYERSSVIPERQLVTTALKHGLGSVIVEGVYEELAKHRDLIRRSENGHALVTTRQVLNEEKAIAAFAIHGRGRHRPLRKHDPAGARELVEGLTPTQAAAVRHVWSSPDRLILVRGAAGTGKTTLTRAALAGVNVPWVILAPSAEASRGVLRRDGFAQADTLAKFLSDEAMQAKVKGGLIWLDEASLAGARDMARLIQVADSAGARVVLAGDRRQHKSVSRGDVLALLEDRAGLPVAEVSEIKRQSGQYKDAVARLARGDVAGGLGLLDELGWVKQADHEADLSYRVAADYLAAVRDGKSALVISPTHAQAGAVTAAIRDRLKTEGRVVKEGGQTKEVGALHGEEREFTRLVPLHLTQAQRAAGQFDGGTVLQLVRNAGGRRAGTRLRAGEADPPELAKLAGAVAAYREEAVRLSAGDTVRVTANGWDVTGKHRLNNGAVYQVDGFTEAGNIRLSNGWALDKDFGHLDHGYVVTSHAAQGRTVDRVLVAMGAGSFGAVGKEQFYVSVSRGRQQATIYTDSPDELAAAVHREDHRPLASDLVRVPRSRLRQRMKRFLAFMRSTVSLGSAYQRDREHTQQHERSMSYGR